MQARPALRKGAAENGGDYLLALTPRKHRMKKAVEEVLLSVDGKTMLPSKIAYEAKDGSRRTIVFRNTQLNPQLAAKIGLVRFASHRRRVAASVHRPRNRCDGAPNGTQVVRQY